MQHTPITTLQPGHVIHRRETSPHKASWLRSVLAALFVLPLAANVAGGSEQAPRLLYRQDFNAPVSLRRPDACWETGCWQEIDRAEAPVPSLGARAQALSAAAPVFMLITDPVETSPDTVGDYMDNRIETVAGPHGGDSPALKQSIHRNINGAGPMAGSATQNELLFVPEDDGRELYLRYWLRLQPDLVERMTGLPDGPGVHGGGTWRAFFGMKTGSINDAGEAVNDGDYRIEAYVMTFGSARPYWLLMADDNAGGNAGRTNDWTVRNRRVPVPVGEWFLFEIYWRRSTGPDGLVWMGINCRTVVDRSGPNVGAQQMPVNRIMAPLLYTGGEMPVYQWVDEIEIWSGLPPDRCDRG